MKKLLPLAAALLIPSAAHAEWHEASSAHFVVYADQPPEKLRAFATKLERFDKAMRHMRGLGDPELGPANRLTVYVVDNVAEVQKLLGKGVRNAAGAYIGRATGSVAFVPRRAGNGSKFEINADTVFFHEYAHHFMLANYSGTFPAWFTEGFAEFNSTARFEADGAVGIGLPAHHRSYGLSMGAEMLPLARMLDGDTAKLNDLESASLYARGWLLVHYLYLEPTRRGQLSAYLKALDAGRGGAAAAAEAFGDLRVLDRDLARYARQRTMTYNRIAPNLLAIAPVSVRPLRAGEAAFMPVRMRSVRGVNRVSAPALVSDGRRAAAPYPADPQVQGALAEVEYDARNLAEAEAAADRALAADPNNSQALVYKGRILMARAVEAGSKDVKVWREVRRWFVAASKADGEDPEPKMLFHATYAAAGQTPTANAVEALVYAQTLAPQDSGLRMQVVYQHLRDGKAAAARQVLGPIAFNPHANAAARGWTAGLMARLDAGDAKGALALWDQRAIRAPGQVAGEPGPATTPSPTP